MTYFLEPISEYVWNAKYRYRHSEKILDKTLEHTWQRVAKAIAFAEHKENRVKIQKQFEDILTDFQFLPGGRILAGAGTKHIVTLLNCFVMPILEDSIHGIFDALKEAALTLQAGGGVGYDFSELRPNGFPVVHAGSVSSGPVSFMRIWDAMCGTMQSTGARRGAMMGVLRVDHPDIETFLKVKSEAHELAHFNISVLVSDLFMQKVEHDQDWELVFPCKESSSGDTVLRRFGSSRKPILCRVIKRVKARDLWEKIIRSAYDYAEPGVLFEDTINSQNNLWYREWITTTNPCGEIPLPSYGACDLGSINLTQFVLNPFTDRAEINWKKLEKVTSIATRFLDNVIEVSRYPLKMQKQESFGTRRIGLGITGLADLLVMMNLKYGSEASLDLASTLMKTISYVTWDTSVELAKERGSFPFFHKEKYLQGHFVETLPTNIKQDIDRYGIRNSHHNTIAPAGTISLLANNVSNGIEPIFSVRYQRTVRESGGDIQKFDVTDYVFHQWKKYTTQQALPPAFIDAQALKPVDHLKMQAAVQPYIDHAISKTINLPPQFPFEALHSVYTESHRLGLKGCTVYRSNPIRRGILQLSEDDDIDRCCQFL